MKKFSLSIFCLSTLFNSVAIGMISSPTVELTSRDLQVYKVNASKQCTCICDVFKGGDNSKIKSPQINIVTKDFQFTGVIECSGECVITTAEEFDHSICDFKGEGNFVFNVDASAVDKARSNRSRSINTIFSPKPKSDKDKKIEALCDSFYSKVKESDCKAEGYIRAAIEELKDQAKQENISEKELLAYLKSDIKSRISSCNEALGLDKSIIGTSVYLGLLSGIAIAFILYVPEFKKKPAYNSMKMSWFGVGGIALGAAAYGGLSFVKYWKERQLLQLIMQILE